MNVDVVTPSRQLVKGVKVDSLKVPTVMGEIEILQGHTQLLCLLGTGVLTFYSEGRTRKFVVSYGFVEVQNERVLILAETCEEAHEIDKARAKKAQRRAEEALTSTLSREEFAKFERKLQRALIRQQTGAKNNT